MENELIIVDDDRVLLVILEKMFVKVNPELSVLTFFNGQEALDYLKSNKFKVVPFFLVDLFLKDMTGWEFLDKLEADGRFESKIILITSSVDSQNSVNSSKYKCITEFFEKPILLESIKKINRLILDHQLN